MFYLIILAFFLASIILLILIIISISKKRCHVCNSDCRGVIYKVEENDLIDSGLVKTKDLNLLRQYENIKTHTIRVCLDCKLAINEELKNNHKKIIPDIVKNYFKDENLDQLVSLEIKKSEFAHLTILIFLSSLCVGVGIMNDFNSLFTIIGAEGIMIYAFTWIIHRQTSWQGYSGKKGIVMWQNYGKYKLFYREYNWVRVKKCDVKNKVLRLHFNERDFMNYLFFLEFGFPQNVFEKQHFMSFLKKNNITKKN